MILRILALLAMGAATVTLAADATETLRGGATLMPVKVYSPEEEIGRAHV